MDEVDEKTRQAEQAEAHTSASADRPPTPSESEAAESNELDPEVAESFKEAAETGAKIKGEGEIEP